MDYSHDPDLRADGHPTADSASDRGPRLSANAKAYIASAEDIDEALFAIADVFRVPLTNNIPRFEDDDPNLAIYHAGDFVEQVCEAFRRAGWRPDTRCRTCHGDGGWTDAHGGFVECRACAGSDQDAHETCDERIDSLREEMQREIEEVRDEMAREFFTLRDDLEDR